ncbi:MAG: VCBS repeat-containing protein [Polyangiales bacterium]
MEVCADRPCTRLIEQAEVSGSSWRPTMRLPPGVVFWRVRGLSASGGVAWTSATWEIGVGRCDAERDTSLRPLYDFDGDGYDDALMGFETSTVGVLWGRPDEHAPVLSDIDGSGKGFTTAATTQGDIDGDGLADLAVGFPGYVRRTDTTSDMQFAAYRDVWGIYYGDRGCGLRAEPTRGDGFVTPAICDINGDGFGDVAVGSRRGVGVFLGSPTGLAGAPVLDVRFEDVTVGFSTVRCDGDANGDGYADVLVAVHSAFEGDGSAAVLYGAPDARIDRRVQRVSNQGGGEFGYSARWTDLDGDGFSDAVIGARSRFWLFRGTSSGLDVAQSVDRRLNRIDGTGCGPEVPMVSADDFDGDGRGDVLATRCASAGFFLSNGTPLTTSMARWFVRSADGRDRVGSASSPGDMNGDGRGDVLLSMWTNSGTGILTGPFTLNLHLLRGDGFAPPSWSWEFPFQPVLDTY